MGKILTKKWAGMLPSFLQGIKIIFENEKLFPSIE